MSVAKASASSLEEKLNAMEKHFVHESVERWAEAHGAEIPEHLRAKDQEEDGAADMYMSGADMTQLSDAIFQQRAHNPDMKESPERQLLHRWLDGVGPMREMGALLNGVNRDACIGRMRAHVVQQGKDILVKGEANDSIWLVVSGRVQLMVPARMSRLMEGKAVKKEMEKVSVKLISVRNVPMGTVRQHPSYPFPAGVPRFAPLPANLHFS